MHTCVLCSTIASEAFPRQSLSLGLLLLRPRTSHDGFAFVVDPPAFALLFFDFHATLLYSMILTGNLRAEISMIVIIICLINLSSQLCR